TDKHGNIIVKRYTTKAARFTIPWNKLPQVLVGLPISLYSLGAYLQKEDRLDDYGLESLSSFYNWEGIFGLLLAGSIGFGLTAFLGYSFLTKGFNLKKWPRSFRELVAIWMGSIIVTALISPFLTEPGLTRQQTDDEFVPNDGNVDLTGLSSPFYASLLNGLLDLLGNIPTPLEEVGFVTDNDGEGFDYARDRYLYRWRVAETYSTELQDFEQAFLSQTNDYRVYEDFQSGDPDQQRALTIEEQYLTISSGYLGEALTPWNSLEGATIGETDSIDARIVNEGSFAGGTSKSFTDINEQPILQASFSAARTQGFLTYDAYWVAEDKETLAANSILYDDLQDTLKDYDKTRFGDLDAFDQVTNNPFDAIWGLGSLPGIDRTAYITGDSGTFSSTFNANGDGIGPFERKYNDLTATLTSETTIYNFILLLANQMQSTILKGLTDGSLSIDPTQTSGVADPGADKAYWFFDAVDDNQEQGIQFGMKELLAGYVNILRAFGIPARPIIGFSVGDTMNDGGTPGLDDDSRADDTTCKSSDCDYIQILFKHLHVWVEALIPWVDNNGDMQFSWGILNPIPDPWILGNDQTDLEYGRNALGGSADVELELLSGSDTNLGESLDIGPLGTVDSFSIQNFGETVDGQTRVLFEDTPTGGQDVELKLFTQADIDALGTDPDPLVIFDAGLSIATISTDPDDPDGWGDFSLRAERNGDLFFINPDLSEDQVLNDDNSPFVVEALDFLVLDIADTNIYILVAIYGLSANVVALAWDLSVLITLELDQIVPGDPLTFPNPT
ncbi:MAG: hypothetical protein IH840_17795, partial [Candidatus Heimdallarchaeota archaeon]|nr:hypothetical protein [Candidatus Heimdallarchaeota archaeon]